MKKRGPYSGLIVSLSIALLFGGSITSVHAQTCVTTEPEQGLADEFERFTVTGITTPLPGPDPNPPGLLGAAFLRAADLNGDGQKEIVVTSGSGDSGAFSVSDSSVAVFTRTSEDLSTWTQSVIRADFDWANDMLLRDVNGDGQVDIIVFDNFLAGQYTNNPAGIYILKNLGGDITVPGNWERITLYAEDPSAEGIDAYERAKRRGCYHQGYFEDLDGDGHDDLVTTRISMELWQAGGQQYMWTEWFRAETDLTTFPTGFSGPYDIGDGIGFLMELHDVDDDGLLDIIGPQFFITESGSLTVKGSPDGSDPYGDSLVWFKNPGQAALAAEPNSVWERYTIDNWYTSVNPIGKAFALFPADITNDGSEELIAVTHNHQEYIDGERLWPSGLYYLDIPDDPYDPANWTPVTIDAGDAYLVDRDGGPYSQGSPGNTAVGDITGNGLADIVVAGDGRGAVYYYEAVETDGNCSLNFKRAALYDDPASMPAEIKLYDIDDDGELEILGTVYDTSFAKDSSAASVFIWKMIPQAECLEDSDCQGGVCEDNACVECALDVDCVDSAPYCASETNICVECMDDDDCDDGGGCINNICIAEPDEGLLEIDKCKVKAGKNGKGDSMQFSGLLDATEANLLAEIGGDIIVTIEADGIPDQDVTTFTFLIAEDYLKKGKYKAPKVKPANKNDPVTSLQIDSIKGKIKFSGKNLDLTGLSCPITITIQIGEYAAEKELNEDIVNGTKKPCPLELKRGI